MMITWYTFSWEPLDTYKFKIDYPFGDTREIVLLYVRRDKQPQFSLVQMNNVSQSCRKNMKLEYETECFVFGRRLIIFPAT